MMIILRFDNDALCLSAALIGWQMTRNGQVPVFNDPNYVPPFPIVASPYLPKIVSKAGRYNSDSSDSDDNIRVTDAQPLRDHSNMARNNRTHKSTKNGKSAAKKRAASAPKHATRASKRRKEAEERDEEAYLSGAESVDNEDPQVVDDGEDGDDYGSEDDETLETDDSNVRRIGHDMGRPDPEKAKLLAQIRKLEEKTQHNAPKKNVKMQALIKTAVRRYVFRKFKFVDRKIYEHEATEMCYIFGKFEKIISKEAFHEKYTDGVMQEINRARQYVQSNIRKAVFNYMRKNGLDEVPDYAIIEGCVARKKPEGMSDSDFQDFFDWYVDVLLPVGACNKSDWSPNVRSNMKISEVVCPVTNKVQITPSTEAFIALVWANCQLVWNVQWHYNATYHPDVTPQAKNLTEEELKALPKTLDQFKKQFERIQDADIAALLIPPNKYTSAFKGQVGWGGWSKEGRKKLAKLRGMNKEGRETEASKALEANALAQISSKRGGKTSKKTSKANEPADEMEDYGLIDNDE